MSPEGIAALFRDYGSYGALALALGVIGWLFSEVRAAHQREVDAQKAYAAELLSLYGKSIEASAALTASLNALNVSIEHRNPLTAGLGETQKAANQAIEHLSDVQERLLRSLEEDRRENDRQKGVADATRAEILATLRRVEARIARR